MSISTVPRFAVLLTVCFVLPLWPGVAAEAEAEEAPPKLLGKCTVGQLDAEPFDEWYRPGYTEYVPHAGTLAELNAMDLEPFELTVFFGTWCGDSRREVPRLVKLLGELGFPDERLTLVAVDNVDESLKRSPDGEETGREIYRVPTIVIHRNGRELSRIVEHPVLSLERDLLAIVDGQRYLPSYASYPVVRGWLDQGLLSDPNVDPRGLANQVRHQIATEGELAAAARVLLTRDQVDEAVKLFQVNCTLHRDSASCQARLAEALLVAGEPDQARDAALRALGLDEQGIRVESLAELIEEIERSR